MTDLLSYLNRLTGQTDTANYSLGFPLNFILVSHHLDDGDVPVGLRLLHLLLTHLVLVTGPIS